MTGFVTAKTDLSRHSVQFLTNWWLADLARPLPVEAPSFGRVLVVRPGLSKLKEFDDVY